MNNNINNNNPIYKVPKALASEALVAGQSWVLLKSLTEEVRLKPRFKDRQWVIADYCLQQRVPGSWRRTAKSSSHDMRHWASVCDAVCVVSRNILSQEEVMFAGCCDKAVDMLAFEILIPKSVIQRYISLLLEHRRIILSGPSGTGKTYLTQKLAKYIVSS